LFRAIRDAVSILVVLLLDLPQDRRRRRIRDQHHGPRRHPESGRPPQSRRLSGEALTASENSLARPALLLQALREPAVALGPALERMDLSVRLGDRHEAAGAERAAAHLPRFKAVVGPGAEGPARQALCAVSARGDHRLASHAGPAALNWIAAAILVAF